MHSHMPPHPVSRPPSFTRLTVSGDWEIDDEEDEGIKDKLDEIIRLLKGIGGRGKVS